MQVHITEHCTILRLRQGGIMFFNVEQYLTLPRCRARYRRVTVSPYYPALWLLLTHFWRVQGRQRGSAISGFINNIQNTNNTAHEVEHEKTVNKKT